MCVFGEEEGRSGAWRGGARNEACHTPECNKNFCIQQNFGAALLAKLWLHI